MNKVRIPVPKSQAWNQSNPYINLNDFDNFGKLPPESGAVLVYNLSGVLLGLGLFSQEEKRIAYLCQEDMPIQEALAHKLREARQRRQNCQTEDYRLIHHRHDNLPGVVIEKYCEIYILRTYDSAADSLIPELVTLLTEEFSPKAILLKNNFKNRQQKGLTLRDQILAGNLNQDIIQIQEGPFTYEYDTKNNANLFPIEMRPIRSWLNQLLAAPSYVRRGSGGGRELGNILLIGEKPEHLISLENGTPCESLETDDQSLTQITENLRTLSKKINQPFNTVIINQFPIHLNEKNKTALFHVYYQALKMLGKEGNLFLKCEDWPRLKQLLKHTGKKLNRKTTIKEKVTELLDFPSDNKKQTSLLWIQLL